MASADSFHGPLAVSFSSSRSSNYSSAAYGVLSKQALSLYDELVTPENAGTPLAVIDLSTYTSVQPGSVQQGLTWEILLVGSSSNGASEKSAESNAIIAASTKERKSEKTNWLKAKLRSKSISQSASFNSLASLASSGNPSGSGSPPPLPPLPTSYSSRRLSATPLTPISTSASRNKRPSTASQASSSSLTDSPDILFSTISKKLQQQWIAAFSAALQVEKRSASSLPSSSSLPSLVISSSLSSYNFPRRPSPSPLRMNSSDSTIDPSASFLELGPPSPASSTFAVTLSPTEETPKSANFEHRISASTNPLLPQWLNDVRAQSSQSGGSGGTIRTSRSSSGLSSRARSPDDLVIPSRGIKISIHEEEISDVEYLAGRAGLPSNTINYASSSRREANATTTSDGSAGKSSTISCSFLRPSPSSTSLSSSSMFPESSRCSTAASTDPPTPVLSFLSSPPLPVTPKESPGLSSAGKKLTSYFSSSPNSSHTIEDKPSSSKAKALHSRAMSVFTGSKDSTSACGQGSSGRSSTDRASSKSSTSTTSTSIASFVSPRPTEDTSQIGRHIMEPAELRRRMQEKTLVGSSSSRSISTLAAGAGGHREGFQRNHDGRPGTAPTDFSKYTFGKAHPGQAPSSTGLQILRGESPGIPTKTARAPSPLPAQQAMPSRTPAAVTVDVQALFAALPPPRKRTVTGMKPSASSASIALRN